MTPLSFYHVAAIAAFAMFLCTLAIVLFLIYRQESSGAGGGGGGAAYPPVASTCPDLWTYEEKTENNVVQKYCKITINTETGADAPKNPGSFLAADKKSFVQAKITEAKAADKELCKSIAVTADPNDKKKKHLTFDPDDKYFSKGQPAVCGRKRFAQWFGISWEGVSNYNQCEI